MVGNPGGHHGSNTSTKLAAASSPRGIPPAVFRRLKVPNFLSKYLFSTILVSLIVFQWIILVRSPRFSSVGPVEHSNDTKQVDCIKAIVDADNCLGYESPLVDDGYFAKFGEKFRQVPGSVLKVDDTSMQEFWRVKLSPLATEVAGQY